ncbi:MAG: hypothetical protein HYU84_00555 [Chloroflexi bacterium]|nr:hypothetical protein [Chloroflexota bacterium]
MATTPMLNQVLNRNSMDCQLALPALRLDRLDNQDEDGEAVQPKRNYLGCAHAAKQSAPTLLGVFVLCKAHRLNQLKPALQ